MSGSKILLVDDESDVLEGLVDYLGKNGFDVDTATNGEMALNTVKMNPPDLVILDVRMPGMDGIEVCRRLRKLAPETRIIFLSALQQDVDKAKGLMIGGDDYIAKPFSTLELLARVKAVLRRNGAAESPEVFKFGDVSIVPLRRDVIRAGAVVEMTAKEFDLVYYLVQHQGEALSRDQLLESVWGQDQYPTTRTVDFHIFQLRKKLEENSVHPEYFRTIRGVGYKFVNE